MKSYQIVIEGVFVNAPELGRHRGGFNTTFYVKANNAPNAAHRVKKLLSERMRKHSVAGGDAGWDRAYYWVSDLWEIADEKHLENVRRDSGFTFFRIGLLEKYYLAARRFFLYRYRHWLLVRPES